MGLIAFPYTATTHRPTVGCEIHSLYHHRLLSHTTSLDLIHPPAHAPHPKTKQNKQRTRPQHQWPSHRPIWTVKCNYPLRPSKKSHNLNCIIGATFACIRTDRTRLSITFNRMVRRPANSKQAPMASIGSDVKVAASPLAGPTHPFQRCCKRNGHNFLLNSVHRHC